MKMFVISGILALAWIGSLISASAVERTITLAVGKMVCPICAFNVKKALEGVAGVANVRVSLKENTAVVVYDDAKADVDALTSATARAGFPSAPRR